MFIFLNEFFFRLFFVLEGFLKCGNFGKFFGMGGNLEKDLFRRMDILLVE